MNNHHYILNTKQLDLRFILPSIIFFWLELLDTNKIMFENERTIQ